MVILDTPTYLKAVNIENEAVAEITDEGVMRTPEETTFDEPVFEIGLKIGEVAFRWTMNKTSQRNLITKWGQDTTKWIGKKVILWTVKQQAFGKQLDVIYARPANGGVASEV